MVCRICGETVDIVLDLGTMPLANRLIKQPDINAPRYPLAMAMCRSCGNLQLTHCVDSTILYKDYIYVTPDAPSLSRHYTSLIDFMFDRSYLDKSSFLFEFGSNVGRFLDHAKPAVARILGLDPAAAIVKQANAAGVPTVCDYFSPPTAERLVIDHGRADLIVARHCAAHNADAHGFVDGVRKMLGPRGVFAMENAYAVNTVVNQDIGQIYHEHMFYYYARPVRRLFNSHGLEIIDIMTTPIHGGSMVFFGAPIGTRPVRDIVFHTLEREQALLDRETLAAFAAAPKQWALDFGNLIADLRGKGARIALYGASAKATTLINLAAIDSADLIGCADSTAEKVGRYIPGTAIKIRTESEMISEEPDYFVITAPNYSREIVSKVRASGNRKSQFYTVFPAVGPVEELYLSV